MWSKALRVPSVRWIQAHYRPFSTSPSIRARIGARDSQGLRNTLRKEPTIRRAPPPSPQQQQQSSSPEAPHNPTYIPAQNTLLAPVHIPEDPNGILKENHPATNILANSGLVVQRQLELMNVMIGFEQANKYVIMDAHGNHVGYMAEQESGMANMMARQWLRTHRSFVTHVFDRHENEVLRFHRPFAWINSRIRVYDPLDMAKGAYPSSVAPQNTSTGSLVQASGDSNARVSPFGIDDMRVIGEAQQQWAPLRRKYNLFTYHHSPNPATDMKTERVPLSETGLSNAQQMQMTQTAAADRVLGEFNQFAYVDEPFLSWDFSLRSSDSRLIGSVNRDFAGFARELFTDTGVYALRMDSASFNPPGSDTSAHNNPITGMSFDQRAVMLATAVSIDFDYFSRHSGHSGGFFPLWFPEFGGGTAAGEAGAAGETAAGAAGRAGAAGGMSEGAAAGTAGAGTMAGYEAMQRGSSAQGDATEQQQQQQQQQQPPPDNRQQAPPSQQDPYGEIWSEEKEKDPWGDRDDDDDPWGSGGGDGGDDGSDWF